MMKLLSADKENSFLFRLNFVSADVKRSVCGIYTEPRLKQKLLDSFFE